jgi:hypothetical protein
MSLSLNLQPVRVGNGSDEEGMLVFDDGQRLVAVLTEPRRVFRRPVGLDSTRPLA